VDYNLYLSSELSSSKNVLTYQMISACGGHYVVLSKEMAEGLLQYLLKSKARLPQEKNNTIICLKCNNPFIVDDAICRCCEDVPGNCNYYCFIGAKYFEDIDCVFKKIKNGSKLKKLASSRKALEDDADGHYDVSDLDIIYKIQAGLCYYCMSPIYDSGNSKYSIDHIVPLSSGGSSWPGNIALTCKSCNSKKSWTAESIFIKKIRRDKSVDWIDEHKEFILFIKRHKRKEFASRSDSKA
jgi:hypothetical protein